MLLVNDQWERRLLVEKLTHSQKSGMKIWKKKQGGEVDDMTYHSLVEEIEKKALV